MKKPSLQPKSLGKRKDPGPLAKGVTTSLSLIVAGLAGALVYSIVAWGRDAVWLSPFISCWVSLCCFSGGLTAGLRGGSGVWWPAGQIGVLGGGLVLAILALMSPESLGFGDLLTYCLLPAGLSCAGALAGANIRVQHVRKRNYSRGGDPIS